MKRFPLALQLYSVRDEMAADFEGTLRCVAEMGYDGVEFAGLFGRSADEVKAACAAAGLTPISAHVPLFEMLDAPDEVMARYAAIGCRYVAIPHVGEEFRAKGARFPDLIEAAKTLGEAAARHGMTLLYHNHDFEFETIDGTYMLEVLYNAVSADLLKTQLDTCWVNVGGEEPAAYVQKFSGRAPVVHLKDFVMPGKKPAKLYALIGVEEEGDTPADPAAFEYRPLGLGAQDIPAILSACEDAQTQWIVVEQDEPSMGKSRMECAAISREYLKTLGL